MSPDFYCETCDVYFFDWEMDQHQRCSTPGAKVTMRKTAEPIALFDLDGTLADFDKAMQAKLKELAAPGEYQNTREYSHQEHIQARWDLIKMQAGFWENLERFQLGFDILEVARELEFINHILTKGPVNTTSAWTEKAIWCKREVPDCLVTIGMDKGLMYGKMLTDDWPKYMIRWLEWRPRGLGIMPAQSWNKDFSHPNVVRYDGTNLAEVRDRMEEIRATAD